MEKNAQDIRSSLATIRGICEVALKDVADADARQYMRKLANASEGLSKVLLLLKP